ncbi:hypothetical protein Pmani_015157 [Petrolisthes manimaculis]|uniref:Nuclease EXOG, mitochondrial n=1 Tax=Petrolisthes manimaculis TaxID=1843537 RepID=A0AAE1PU16_9EUCA|nr:hypothetical protein Pmani_015157 [Petrolisthes manimaculis]
MRATFLTGLVAGSLSTVGIINISKFWIPDESANINYTINSQNDPEQIQQEEGKVAQEVLSEGRPWGGRIRRTLQNHVLEYDCATKIPIWVAEHLTADSLKGDANRSKSKFKMDPNIPEEFSSQNSDYYGSGWSRGHMSPAGDCKNSQASMDETFYLSNILPQDFNNNGGFWNRLEIFCRDLTERYRDVWITSGPLFLPRVRDDGRKVVEYEVIGDNEVAVPTHLYKVVVGRSNKDAAPAAVGAFIVPNAPLDYSHHLTQFQVPLDKLERKVGLKFCGKLNRHETRDLCEETGCNLLTKTQMDQMIFLSRLKKAKNIDKLNKIWKEIQERDIPTDTKLLQLYQTRLTDFSTSGMEERAALCPENQNLYWVPPRPNRTQ